METGPLINDFPKKNLHLITYMGISIAMFDYQRVMIEICETQQYAILNWGVSLEKKTGSNSLT